jgi:hypothetical protein
MGVGKAEVRLHTGGVCDRADNTADGRLGQPQPAAAFAEQALR